MRSIFTAALFLVLGTSAVMAQDTTTTVVNEAKESRFFVTGGINYAYRVAKIPNGYNSLQKEYIKKLKSGISFDLSAFYKINDMNAVGLKYNVYKSANEINGAAIEAPNGETGIGTVSDDITISFYGVAYNYIGTFGKHDVTLEMALGYMGYRNDAEALGSYEFSGGTVGAAFGINYKYEVFDNFHLGPQISLIGGSISEFDLKGPDGFKETIKYDDDNRESLTRIDVGLVVKYSF